MLYIYIYIYSFIFYPSVTEDLLYIYIFIFYPSITEGLLSKSLEYTRTIEAMDEKIVKVINHSRRSLFFDKYSVWVKKNNPNFDVTIGSYDGTELCELTGLYIPSIMDGEFDYMIKKYRIILR